MSNEKFITLSIEENKIMSRLHFLNNQLRGNIINYQRNFEKWGISQEEYSKLIDTYLESFLSLKIYMSLLLKDRSIEIQNFNSIRYDISLKKIFYREEQE